MRKINLEECHELVLEIAKEFARICEKHKINYYMLGGTMLGAIRHKGFIPWDDDMDFGVPRSQYDYLLEVLKKELPDHIKCYTYRNNRANNNPFAKVTNITTHLDDKTVGMPIEKQLGVNIDIFPLDFCNKDDKKLKSIFRWIKFGQVVYIYPPRKSAIKSFVKKCLQLVCPVRHKSFLDWLNKKAASLEPGNYLGNVFGHWKSKEIIPIEWYGEKVKYEFEDTYFYGLKEYDKYLTQMYNNYMELPPVEKRIAHSAVAYKIKSKEC